LNWIKVETEYPKINIKDEWDKEHQISEQLLCYSPQFGIRFGRYYYEADIWVLDGCASSNGINVTHWQYLSKPQENK
jgi:hypothetical protein